MLFRGMDVKALYPYGVPKRTFPYREHAKQISMAPMAGGFYLTKYALGLPLQIPFEWLFYRSAIVAFAGCVLWDLLFGFPLPFMKETKPGSSKHFFRQQRRRSASLVAVSGRLEYSQHVGRQTLGRLATYTHMFFFQFSVQQCQYS